jgi:hypothetical protein
VCQGKKRDVVGSVAVSLEVEVSWDLRADGEALERDAALDQAWDVEVTAVAAFEKVPAPQQRIGVKVDDAEGPMQVARSVGYGRPRLFVDGIEASVGPGD